MKSIYVPVSHEGIWEIIRLDDNGVLVTVQTNIRTPEKALQACAKWEAREQILERATVQSGQSERSLGNYDDDEIYTGK